MGQVIHPKLFPQCPVFGSTCINADPTGGNAYTINTMSLAAAMYAYWVPRRWKVSIDVTQTDPPGQEPVTYNFIFGSTAQREEDLVCEPTWELENDQGWEGCGFSLFWNFIDPAPLCGVIDGYRIYGGGFFSQNAEGNDDSIEFGGSLFNEPQREITIGAGPYSYSFPLWQASSGLDPGSLYQIYSNFNIEPISYWSYGGTWDMESGYPL